DFVEAVCWLGARLAEALAHAHGKGILHRDIKPANILLNRYGRPLLADFNVAFDAQRTPGPGGGLGGTLAYMAPEHLDAFDPAGDTPAEAVDERSDVYPRGVVLFELLTGRLPFPAAPSGDLVLALGQMAAERRRGVPLEGRSVEVPDVLGRVLGRCLA